MSEMENEQEIIQIEDSEILSDSAQAIRKVIACEFEKRSNELFINPIFDIQQRLEDIIDEARIKAIIVGGDNEEFFKILSKYFKASIIKKIKTNI